jgi:hypothetical protein
VVVVLENDGALRRDRCVQSDPLITNMSVGGFPLPGLW